MSILSVYQDTAHEQPLKVLTHLEDIAPTLAEVGVRLERREASGLISAGASPQDVMTAYRPYIDRLRQERGHAVFEVISVSSDHPEETEKRARILEEHQHGEDEMLFVVAGRGLLNLHIADKVFALLCEKSDLISLPAGTRQWFDMGEDPRLVAIRLFNNPAGRITERTGDDIASRFPRLDQ